MPCGRPRARAVLALSRLAPHHPPLLWLMQVAASHLFVAWSFCSLLISLQEDLPFLLTVLLMAFGRREVLGRGWWLCLDGFRALAAPSHQEKPRAQEQELDRRTLRSLPLLFCGSEYFRHFVVLLSIFVIQNLTW